MGANPRNKGGKWERDLKALFEDFTGVTWERVRGSGAFDKKGDIYPAYNSFPFLIEAKHTANWSAWDFFQLNGPIFNTWWDKIKEEAKEAKRLPMLICKSNYKPPVIVLSKEGDNKLKPLIKSSSIRLEVPKHGMVVYLLEDVIRKGKGVKLVG